MDWLNHFCINLKAFLRQHESFFSIGFIVLFTSEQAILIILISFVDDKTILGLIIGLFSLVVISTASFQKFVLETKRKYDNQKRTNARQDLIQRYKKDNMRMERLGKIIEKLRKELKK